MSKRVPPAPAVSDEPVAFFETPGLDQLYGVCLALAEQLSVTRDRLDTLERILDSRGTLSRDELNDFEPSQQDEAEKEQIAADIVERILMPVAETISQFEKETEETKIGGAE